MESSIITSVWSMARKMVASIHGSSSSSSLSSSSPDQVLSGMKKDLESLERTLRRIQAVLNDAEERGIGDASVKLWLKELRWVAYDAENVLGEYQYEIRRAEIITSASAAETSLKRKKPHDDQVYDFTSVLLRLSIPQKIRDIMERFEEISKARKDLQLREEDGTRRHSTSYVPQQSSSSHVDESGIFGREDDKEAVIQMLLSDKVSSKISVISIVGMGGLGKTTLAQCVYNHPRICQHFDSMGWVCVSEDFDVKRLTGEIIQSITKQSSCGLTQLDALQFKLKEIVDGKKMLVVLDDVWNERPCFWESLKVPFLSAATTRVLVTTRNELVAKIMQTAGNIYRLGCLPEDKCWTLFCHYAFSGRNPEEHPRLVGVGKKIMQKCGGLPLAVKTLGSLLLHYGTDEESWREVLESEIWNLDGAKDDILPALKLSYYRMPTHLKPCFLFTSLYPKDFLFEKQKVIKMWMAQDYILPRGNKRLEDIGSEYFDELQRRSFFIYDDHSEDYVLHDIVHDLARYISENEHHSVVLESDGKICPIAAEVRHLFVECQGGTTLCQVPLEITRDLRTLIVHKHRFDKYLIVDDDQFKHSVHLRVLEVDCKRLPSSIGRLKHVCYLSWNWSNDFHDSWIFSQYNEHEPDRSYVNNSLPSLSINNGSCSLSHLYNMQTLYLYCEYDYIRLLNSLRDLANLRLLHVKSLFESANTCILPSIMPDTNPTRRGICYYSTLSKLVEITLSYRRAEWVSLLPFSQLPSLRHLRVESMFKVELVGHENYCYCPLHLGGGADIRKSVITTNNVGFQYLEELLFEDMPKWEEWSGVMGGGDFPCLRKLTLTDCRSLSQIPMLPSSLKTLHISHCNSLKSLPVNNEQVRFPYMEELVFHNMSSWEDWPGLNSGDFPCLRKLTITVCKKLRRFPLRPSSLDKKYHGQQQVGFPCLEEMVLKDIPELQQEWFGVSDRYFPYLRKLTINRCQQLQGFPTLSSTLRDLSIKSCWSLTSLAGLQNLTSLESLKLESCPSLHISPQQGLPSKPQHVEIVDCPFLEEWCHRHQFNCILTFPTLSYQKKKYLGPSELTIYHSRTITDIGVDNLSSLKNLIMRVSETHLFSEGWPPLMIQILQIYSCNDLRFLSLDRNLLLLKSLHIWNCPVLAYVIGLHSLPNLEELSLESCPELQFTTDDSLPSSLQYLKVKDCMGLRSFPVLHEKLSSLQELEVFNCPELTIVSCLCNLSSLKALKIWHCPVLSLLPNEQLPSMPHHVSIAHCPALRGWCEQQSIPYN